MTLVDDENRSTFSKYNYSDSSDLTETEMKKRKLFTSAETVYFTDNITKSVKITVGNTKVSRNRRELIETEEIHEYALYYINDIFISYK